MIDPHVHLRDWSQSSKETVEHGLRVAKAVGITRVFDMPNTNPALTDRETILDRLALGGEAVKKVKGVSYHVWGGLTSKPSQIQEMVETWFELYPMVIGLKLYAGQSTGSMGIIDYESQKRVFTELSKNGYPGVVAVHCEKESLLCPSKFVPGKWETHSSSRPVQAEVQSVKDIIAIAKETGFKGTLHIAHVSTKDAIEEVKAAKKSGMNITMGATAHHALLTVEDAADHDRYLKMNPPLREASDRDAVFAALLDGSIDWIESDHAPHTLEDKEKGSSGIPGFAGTMILIDRLRQSGIDKERLSDLCYKNVCKTFGLEAVQSDMQIPKNALAAADNIKNEYPFYPF